MIYAITGASGSLGTALTHHLLSQGHKVRGLARNEHRLAALKESVTPELRGNLSILCGSVTDRYRLLRAFSRADYVIHAAAMKSIAQAEYDPCEAVQTNVVGTQNVADACIDAGVKRAVFISSDKAVKNVNMYGATKACGEKLWLACNRYSAGVGTAFVVGRYGNVFSSNGSVVPRWLRQVREDGRITITDPSATRFHFRLKDAVRFILETLRGAEAGELRVPLLPAYRVGDMAEAIAPGVPQVVTGLQVGEKRHELMIHSDESIYAIMRDTYYSITPGTLGDGKEFEYSSGGTSWRLTIPQLTEELKSMGCESAPSATRQSPCASSARANETA